MVVDNSVPILHDCRAVNALNSAALIPCLDTRDVNNPTAPCTLFCFLLLSPIFSLAMRECANPIGVAKCPIAQ